MNTARTTGFSNATGLQPEELAKLEQSMSANQAYKNAGGLLGIGKTFKDWITEQKANGNLDKLLGTIKTIDWRNLFNKNNNTTAPGPNDYRGTGTGNDGAPPPPPVTILGMSKGMAIGVGIAAITMIGFGIAYMIKKAK